MIQVPKMQKKTSVTLVVFFLSMSAFFRVLELSRRMFSGKRQYKLKR
jgi:hypothetical protein